MARLTAVSAMALLGGLSMGSIQAADSGVRLNAEWAEKTFNANGGPFSFVYGGTPSGELLKTWKADVKASSPTKTSRRRTLTWSDPVTKLEVQAVVDVYTDTGGVDWTLTFTNKGDRDTPIIERVQALDLRLPATPGNAAFHSIRGCNPNNWIPFDEPLTEEKPVVVGATNGCSSETSSPFFNVQTGTGGIVVGVGWTGQWVASISSETNGRVDLVAGMQFLHLKLQPGESIRSPRILAVQYQGDQAEPYKQFRRTMLAHIMPRAGGKLQTPPIAHLSTSFDELNLTDVPSLLSHLEAVKGLGFTHFWLDAYYTKGGFPEGMGNYGVPPDKVIPDPVRFPNGLKPVADAVAKDGLKFLVWFEPERVAAGTLIAREHSELVISPKGDGSGLFNLGIPAAREYMTRTLDAAVKEWKLGCIRIDFNINPLDYWQHENAKDPERVGIAEIRYVEGLYRMWDDLRASNPGLLIDNCASGGRRIDLETCSRSLALWRTDNTIGPLWDYDFDKAALINQLITGGLNRFVPYSTSGQMGAGPYQFRSGVNGGGISFAEDVRAAKNKGEAARLGREPWGSHIKDLYGKAGYPRDLLKQAVAEAKRTRKYYFGDYYVQSPITADPADWCVFQYDRPKEADGMVLAFRRPKAPPTFTCLGLRGIDPEAEYAVTMAYSYEPSKPVRMKGSVLRDLKLNVEDCPGSVLVEYRKVR